MGKRGKSALNIAFSLVLVLSMFPQASFAEVSQVFANDTTGTQAQVVSATGVQEADSTQDSGSVNSAVNEGDVSDGTTVGEGATSDSSDAEPAGSAGVAGEIDAGTSSNNAESAESAEAANTADDTTASAEALAEAAANELPQFSASALVPSEGSYNVSLSGSGTQEDPYLVSTADELREVALKVNSTTENTMAIQLTSDIDLKNVAWDPMGKSNKYPFKGTFDGQGHTISGLSVNSTDSYKGFIGYASNAVIKNVTLEGTITGKDCTAGVAGYAANTSFENVVNKVNVTGAAVKSTSGDFKSGGNRVGGIVGEASACTFASCGNAGSIHADSSATGFQDGFGSIGGLVGYAWSSFSMTSCYNTSDVSCTTYAARIGGLIGQLNAKGATVEDVYNTGFITHTNDYTDAERIGGLIGDYSVSDKTLVLQNAYQAGGFSVINTSQTRMGYLIGYCYTQLTESFTGVKNLYYVPNDNITYVFGSSTTSKAVANPPAWQAQSVAEDALKAAGFADKLSDNFADDTNSEFNGGFPYLLWQNPNASYNASIQVSLASEANHSDNEGFILTVKNKDGEDITESFIPSSTSTAKSALWKCSEVENGATFNYFISKRGYVTQSGTLEINNSSARAQVALEPVDYNYALTVTPASATVKFMVNGTAATLPTGTTNPNGSITYTFEGIHNADVLTYEISKFAYNAATGTLDSVFFGSSSASVELTHKTAYTATLNLSLTGMPSDTSLALLDKDQQEADLQAAVKELAAEITSEDTEVEFSPLLPEANTHDRPVVFLYYSAPEGVPAADSAYNGTLVYNSDVDGGVEKGEGDLNFIYTIPNLINGIYSYVISFDGFPVKTGSFEVKDANTTHDASMSPLTGDPWDGSIDISWYLFHEDETEFYIDAPEKLAGLSALVSGGAKDYSGNKIDPVSFAGKTIYLANDINLGGSEGKYFTPIGNLSTKKYFGGTFDGQGYAISGLLIGNDQSDTPTTRAHTGSTRSGLFTQILGSDAQHAVVKNLTISKANISRDSKTTSAGYTGILAGEANYTDIENVQIVGGTLNHASPTSAYAGGYVGGLVGYANEYVTFTSCANSAEIISQGYDIGGIAGYLGEGSSAIRCANSGSIQGTSTVYQTTYSYGAGGIAGCVNYSAAGLIACYNTADITASVAAVGGIAGLFGPYSSSILQQAQFVNCYNTGTVINTSTSTTASQLNVGGLAGFLNVYVGASRTSKVVENCYNAGSVSAGENSPETMRVGGLFGTTSSLNYQNKVYLLSNNWYNSSVLPEGIAAVGYLQQGASTAQDMNGMLSPKTQDAMKAAEFVNTLGASYAQDFDAPINGGFPILRWQDPDTKWVTQFNITLDTTANDDFAIEDGKVVTPGSVPELTVRDSAGNICEQSSAVDIVLQEDGTYYFQGGYELANGTYTYAMSKKGYNETLSTTEDGEVYTSIVQGVFVVANDSVSVQKQLTATYYEYTLTVVDELNNPITDANVQLCIGGENGERIEPSTVENGVYTYFLHNGNYWTSVTKYGHEPRVTPNDQLVTISYASASNTPVLNRLSEYELTIKVSPSEGSFRDGIASLNLSCPERTFETQTVQADANGTVTFVNTVAQGTYTFEVRAGYFEKYRGTVEVSDSQVTITQTLTKLGPWNGIDTDITWYNTTDTDFYISTPAELAGFAAIVNGTAQDDTEATVQDSFAGKTVHLLSSISLGSNQWTPIGNATYAFEGTFNGNGCRIEGLMIDPALVAVSDRGALGLFGYVASATIQDVVVAGKITGNCQNVYISDVSGLVARVTAQSDNVTISRCGSEVDITVSASGISHAGGLLGWAPATVSIDQSYNKGAISISSGQYGYYIGGLAGLISGSDPSITASYNTGQVDAICIVQTSIAAVGGLLGSCNSSSGALTIRGCYSTGAVSGVVLLDPPTAVGSILGSRSSASTSDLIVYTYAKTGSADKTVGNGFMGTNATKTIEANEFNTESVVATLNADKESFALNNQTTGTPLLTWERSIVRVEKLTNPTKLSYNDQENFDSSGLTLQATYTSGDPVTIESGWAVLNGTKLAPTQTSVTVDYSGWQFEIPITVTQIEHETISEIDLQIEGPVAGSTASKEVTILSRDDGYYFAQLTWMHAGKEFSGTFEEGSFYRAEIDVTTYYQDDMAWYILPEDVQVSVVSAADTPEPLEILYAQRVENGRSYTLTATFAATSCETQGVTDTSFHLYYEGDENAVLYNSALTAKPALTLDIEGEQQEFSLSDIEQAVLDSNVGYEGTYSNYENEVCTQDTYTGLKLYSFLVDKIGANASDETEITFVSSNGSEHTLNLGQLREPYNVYQDAATNLGTVPALLAFGKNGQPLMPQSSVGSMFTGPLMLVTGQINAKATASIANVSTIRIDKIQAQETQVVSFDVTCSGKKVANPTITLTDSFGNSFSADNNRYSVTVDENFTYLISANGYTTVQGSVRVSDSPITVSVELLKTYSGTPEQAQQAADGYYEIYTAEQLVWWAENGTVNDNVRLMNDIALNDGYIFDKDSCYSWPVAKFGQKEDSAYKGTFDGNGHTIYGFYIYRENTIDLWQFWDGSVGMISDNISQIGLFGYTYNATIKNLEINGRIDVFDRPDSMLASWMQIGAFAGYATSTTFENCTANVGISHVTASGSGSISGVPFDGWPEVQDSHIGGICGTAARSTITNCYTRGEITSGTCRSVSLGGIAGRALSYSSYETHISNCYSTMSLYAMPNASSSFTSYQGGIVGTIGSSGVSSSISGCVALNDVIDGGVSAKSVVARVVGDPSAIVENNRGLATIRIYHAAWEESAVGNGEEISPSASLAKQSYVGVGWAENISREVTATSAGWQFPSEQYPLLYWQDASTPQTPDQVSNDISGVSNRNPNADESSFSEYAPPEHFTLSVQVEGHDAREATVMDATTLRNMASRDSVKYSSYTSYQSYGRVTTEYIPIQELLQSQSIPFGEGDTFVMGGLSMDYETYFNTPRYYFPYWTSNPGDRSDAVQVPTALVLRSYGGTSYTSDAMLDIAVFSADYLYAYMTLFGQTSPTEVTADRFIHQQKEATVLYKANADMNEYLSSLLSSIVKQALVNADATLTSTDASEVEQGLVFVTPNDMAALRSVIAKGQALLGGTGTNGNAMDAIEELEAAIAAFDAAKEIGTRQVSFDGLEIAVNLSNEYLDQVSSGLLVVSDKGEGVSAGQQWVPTDTYNKLVAAVNQANAMMGDKYVSQDVVNELAANMTAIVQDFEDNIKTKKGSVERLWGNYSYDTSLAITQKAFTESEYAIVARCDDFADAMSATGLAGALNAPVLLSETDRLTPCIGEELTSLGVKTVYLIGGEAALTPQVKNDIESLDIAVNRVAGYASWDTSVECAQTLKEVQKEKGITPQLDAVIVATSYSFSDALSMSSFAYKYQVPIILETYDHELTDEGLELLEDKDYFDSSDVYIPGGPAAVPTESVEGTLDSSHTFTRIYGNTGYDTSNEVACYLVKAGLLSADTVCVATGAVSACGVDALSGSALAGKAGGVMLLVNTEEDYGAIDTTTVDKFLANNKASINQAYVLGGCAVINQGMFDRLVALLN